MGIVLQSASSVSAALLTTLLAVALFATCGWLLVRWLQARGGALGRRGRAELEVVERLPLDFKSSLYLVRGRGRTWLIGCGDRGAPRLLAELEGEGSETSTADGATDG